MFNGIVEEIGIVKWVNAMKNLAVLEIQAPTVWKGAKRGGSMAVNGACLTVRDIRNKILVFDVMRETLLKTTLGSLKKGGRVNLERPLKANSRIDGHFVTGHVDGVGTINTKITGKNYTEIRVALKPDIAKYIVRKGSVCLDGVSLTVGKVTKKFFAVHLIPFTKKVTTLGQKGKGDKVNIETDILAKYMLTGKPTRPSRIKLEKEGITWN
ncbi:MAG: riboflavin synthase subunit alpha [Omnitrophica WOR_2 bacterium RIFCSPHIGHO2_02_FULL_52_10]|nr:MAG: riboflavin synthase subunit alpha [Omnitrophica WOR_2 bacterium RIFCSPHIGHO2_02_FULL_52_10]